MSNQFSTAETLDALNETADVLARVYLEREAGMPIRILPTALEPLIVALGAAVDGDRAAYLKSLERVTSDSLAGFLEEWNEPMSHGQWATHFGVQASLVGIAASNVEAYRER